MYVVDVAAAIVAALKDDGTSMGKAYELGGPEIFTVHELVTSLPFCFKLSAMLGDVTQAYLPCRQSLCSIRFVNGLAMSKFPSLLQR